MILTSIQRSEIPQDGFPPGGKYSDSDNIFENYLASFFFGCERGYLRIFRKGILFHFLAIFFFLQFCGLKLKFFKNPFLEETFFP
jgi:hypothetical protein